MGRALAYLLGHDIYTVHCSADNDDINISNTLHVLILRPGEWMPPLVSESIAWLAKRRFLLPALLVLRVLNSLVVRTFFNPDEYWQGPEVAHHMVWGVGHL